MTFERLKEGDRVGIVAPASAVSETDISGGRSWLESLGFRVRVGASIGQRDRFLAGSDDARASDLLEMFADPEVRAIFTARGGYGSSRMLDRIDWETVKGNPKPFVGFSDTTALQLGMYTRAGLPSLTGLALRTDAREGEVDDTVSRDLLTALREGTFAPVDGLEHDRTLSGVLVGGCLSLVVHLLGTPYFPDLTGHVLLIEDVAEAPYRVDRMLTQLHLSRVLEKASGCAVGIFHRCEGDDEDGTIDEVIAEFAERCPCPLVRGVPYGHQPSRRVLPIGAHVSVVDGVMTFGKGTGWKS